MMMRMLSVARKPKRIGMVVWLLMVNKAMVPKIIPKKIFTPKAIFISDLLKPISFFETC